MGTPDFAAVILKELAQWPRGEVVAVYTRPDKPAGRGHKLTPSPVKRVAQELDLPVLQPGSLKMSRPRPSWQLCNRMCWLWPPMA